jgi:hypothetical protein
MTIKLILNIILTILIIYIFFIYNVEHLENDSNTQTSTSFTDQQKIDIKKIINELYMSDVDAIRNLSDVATKLQTPGKLILPGDLTVQGNMDFGPNATTINAQINKDGNIDGKKLTFIDGYASGNMVFGPNATTTNAQIEKDGTINGKNLILKGNLKILDGGIINVDNGSMNVTANTIDPGHFKLTNTLKISNNEALVWSMSNIKSNSNNKNGNKLSFSRKMGNATTFIPSLELYDSGDVNIPGNLTVNGNIPGYLTFNELNDILIKKNRVRFIRVGNMKSTDIFTEGEYRAIDFSKIDFSKMDFSNMKFNNTTNSTANTGQTEINRLTRELEIAKLNLPITGLTDVLNRVNTTATNSTTNTTATNSTANTTATNSTANTGQTGQFDWTLIEIRVFDDTGTNIALNKGVSVKSDAAGVYRDRLTGPPIYPLNNIINGKISENKTDTEQAIKNDMIINGYQAKGPNPHQLEIDLKGEFNISQIQLFNIKVPSKTNRMNNTIVELISDYGPRKYITNRYDPNYSNDQKIPQHLVIKRRINTGLWDGIYSKEFLL